MKFHKLLIANRGEIALRIVNTCRKMNIKTVALVTEVEKMAEHSQLADESYIIGSGDSQSSYLNINKLIKIAKETECNLIHPGYGFLSENIEFVKAIEKNKITFVGPNAKAMEQMGAKDIAKQIAVQNNIPTTPGYYSKTQNIEDMKKEANKIGYPIILKAVLGGGGKGMRIVRKEEEFDLNMKSCQQEAQVAFGDKRILLEKYIEDPKHIEVQILGDNYGNVFHFFERDCSIQRRHQKIIEEGPSNLDKELVDKIRETALKVGRLVEYNNAGTVEFLVDKESGNFYFMEMNTRLQVEHPVSEMISGVDLMEMQLRVALGENLKDFQQVKDVRGHCIEARICAEDPKQDFLPSVGKVGRFEFGGRQIDGWGWRWERDVVKDLEDRRLDSGLVENGRISQYYDSMIGKLIVFGKDREESVKKLEKQLTELRVFGVKTNISFLLNLCKEKNFQNFDYSLQYFEEQKEMLLEEKEMKLFEKVGIWGLGGLCDCFEDGENVVGFRNGLIQKLIRVRLKRFQENVSEIYSIFIKQKEIGSSKFELKIMFENEQKNYETEILSKNKQFVQIVLDNRIVKERIETIDGKEFLFVNGEFVEIVDSSFESIVEKVEDEREKFIQSPMPGTVTNIYIKEGDIVKEGDLLMTIEAMKMENKILASNDSKIMKINCVAGEYVDREQILIECEN